MATTTGIAHYIVHPANQATPSRQSGATHFCHIQASITVIIWHRSSTASGGKHATLYIDIDTISYTNSYIIVSNDDSAIGTYPSTTTGIAHHAAHHRYHQHRLQGVSPTDTTASTLTWEHMTAPTTVPTTSLLDDYTTTTPHVQPTTRHYVIIITITSHNASRHHHHQLSAHDHHPTYIAT